ncbi:MAG TPA: MOSC domain-containing protein [Gammaproteobacteria bacterium]|nr:MOSC domain-containing protein [Gammaproteobacteria bacterium]
MSPLALLRRRRGAVVEAIYVAPEAGAPMRSLEAAEVSGAGLAGDRYAAGAGYWQGPDACAVTLIRAEDLERIARRTGLAVAAGEHRRNLVVRGLRRGDLEGGRLVIGEALLAPQGARPPCGYLERLTRPGMARALRGRSGVCLRVERAGTLRVGDIVRIGPGT